MSKSGKVVLILGLALGLAAPAIADGREKTRVAPPAPLMVPENDEALLGEEDGVWMRQPDQSAMRPQRIVRSFDPNELNGSLDTNGFNGGVGYNVYGQAMNSGRPRIIVLSGRRQAGRFGR